MSLNHTSAVFAACWLSVIADISSVERRALPSLWKCALSLQGGEHCYAPGIICEKLTLAEEARLTLHTV